jgi:GNAT superfamily N-acetyltransferase
MILFLEPLEESLMYHVEIRRPKLNDSEQLQHLFRSVIIDTFNKENLRDLFEDIEKEIETKIRYLHLDFESNGSDRYFLLAVINDKIIGTIEFGPSSKLINEFTNSSLRNVVEVGTVLVLPEYQKRGIGRLLFNTILLTLINREIEEFCLDSGYSNAQSYWKQKLGEPDYIFKNYWGEGNDHMIWRKRTTEFPMIFTL